MRRIFVSTLACAVALSLCFGSNAAADDPGISIDDIQYTGSGCPPGSVFVDLAPDGQAFVATYAEFTTEVGPGLPPSASRKHCQLRLTLHVPRGFTYTIAAVDYGYPVSIARGARGMLKQVFYFAGQEPQASTWRIFDGPFDDDWHVRDEVEYANLVWAPCNVARPLNIDTQVRLDKGTSDRSVRSFITIDRQVFHLIWRTCAE